MVGVCRLDVRRSRDSSNLGSAKAANELASNRTKNNPVIQALDRDLGRGTYSKIRIAAAITVVHRPRLSPTALWVTFAVRTILFDNR